MILSFKKLYVPNSAFLIDVNHFSNNEQPRRQQRSIPRNCAPGGGKLDPHLSRSASPRGNFQFRCVTRSELDNSTYVSIFATLDFSKSHYVSEIWVSLNYSLGNQSSTLIPS